MMWFDRQTILDRLAKSAPVAIPEQPKRKRNRAEYSRRRRAADNGLTNRVSCNDYYERNKAVRRLAERKARLIPWAWIPKAERRRASTIAGRLPSYDDIEM